MPAPFRPRPRDGRLTVVGAFVAMLCLLTATDVTALGLGPAMLSSGLGEPLHLSIPVSLQPDEDVGCVQVRPHGDDLPAVYNSRARVVRSGAATRIEIRSTQTIDEPAIGLVVSVGCASPVARDYVLFLDPPTVPEVQAVDAATAAAGLASRTPPSSAPVVRAPRVAAGTDGAAATTTTTIPRKTRSTRPRALPGDGSNTARSATPGVASRRTTGNRSDRLSIVPTEPPVVGRTARSPQPGVFPPQVGVADSAPVAIGGGTGPSLPSTTGTIGPGAGTGDATSSVAPATADGNAALAREAALREQQVALQAQIKTLSDQIAALRVQTTTLVARNQSLEDTTFSPWLIWLLMALTVLAIAIAGWMAWRYTQLRRSLEGSAWWTNNTAQEPSEGLAGVNETRAAPAISEDDARIGQRPVRPVEPKPQAPAPVPPPPSPPMAAVVSNVERSRPMARATSYPPAIDTDFTVSDIEAAMASVRTVTPPRSAKPSAPLGDTDFAALGGPTMPSPFAEPPSAAPVAQTPPASRPVLSEPDPLATFVDLDIPPLMPLAAAPSRPDPKPPASKPNAPNAATPATPSDLDFRLDMPDSFDPLSTDSHKNTVVDPSASHGVDFDLASTPTSLDFELPSATQILSITQGRDDAHADPRHGATALDDLFAPLGVDTILDLDERDGAPLSATEVDRLTATEVDPSSSSIASSVRTRMARFADLMDRVDEIAASDPLRAIAHLRQYVLRDESIPTLLWLRLFELYRVVGKKAVYEALADHFARRYHRPMAGWAESLDARTPQKPLTAMIEIDHRIEAQWGTDDGAELLRTLLCDRTQEDAIVFNAVLQRDLLDAAKIFPSQPPESGEAAEAA